MMEIRCYFNLPYVKLGETIHIEFKGEAPETFELKDYILKKDGGVKHWQPSEKPIDIEFINGKGSFVLHENFMSGLSSNTMDYAPGASIRGFRLICNWENITQEYVFIIKSDAFTKSIDLK